MVNSIIISLLIVVAIVVVVVAFRPLLSLFRRDQESGNNNLETQTKAQAINAAIIPSRAEYERMTHDAIEIALLPITKRIKRLEEKVFSASNDGTHLTETAQPPQAEATQLYDELQDVVLPQTEDVANESKAQGTGQHTVFAEENVEYTTIAPIKDIGVAPAKQDTGIQPAATAPEDDTTQSQETKRSA